MISGSGKKIRPLTESVVVWLHLDDERSAEDQLNALKRSVSAAPVVVLANHPDNEQALTLFSSGIRGYCNAHATAANLRQVAGVVEAGGLWIGEALMQRLLTSTRVAMSRIPAVAVPVDRASAPPEDRLAVLTKREQEVARTIANGASNKEIARQLGITERTVKAHVGAVFQKLKARDRLHLALIVNGQRPS